VLEAFRALAAGYPEPERVAAAAARRPELWQR
jgi:hypothetical protein